jgi:hypothetical protein
VASVPGGGPAGPASRARCPGCGGRPRGREVEDDARGPGRGAAKGAGRLAGARTVAAEWEAEVASARAQLQQDRAALEGAQA